MIAIQIISITAFAGRKSNAHFQKKKFANPLSLASKDHIGIGLCALCLEMVGSFQQNKKYIVLVFYNHGVCIFLPQKPRNREI